jgi:cytochrome c oxidase assembly factor 5
MSKSCKGLAMELVKCLSETDCVKVSRGSAPSSPPRASSLCRRLFRFDFVCSVICMPIPWTECIGQRVKGMIPPARPLRRCCPSEMAAR